MAEADDSRGTLTVVIPTGTVSITESHGRVFTGSSEDKFQYIFPTNPEITKSDLNPGVSIGLPLFTDSTGTLHYTRKQSNGSLTTENVNIDPASDLKFTPDFTYRVDSGLITDSTGKIVSYDSGSAQALTVNRDGKTIILSKPNESVTCTMSGNDCLYTDSTGTLYVGATPITSIKGLRPNQLSDNNIHDHYITNNNRSFTFYYTDASGLLLRTKIQEANSTVYTEKTGLTNLTPGILYPSEHFVIADKTGSLHAVGDTGVYPVSGLTLPAESWTDLVNIVGADTPYGEFYATNSQGILYRCADTCSKVTDIKFKGNQIASQTGNLLAGDLYAIANNGTIYYINVQLTDSKVRPLGFSVNGGGDSSSPCVVQMPTTGAPTGISIAAFISLGLAAVGLLLITKRHRLLN